MPEHSTDALFSFTFVFKQALKPHAEPQRTQRFSQWKEPIRASHPKTAGLAWADNVKILAIPFACFAALREVNTQRVSMTSDWYLALECGLRPCSRSRLTL